LNLYFKEMVKENQTSKGNNNISTYEHFTRLLLANQRRLYGFILSLVPNLTDADDIFQDTVLVMCRKFEGLRLKSSFLAWGLSIARHKIIKFREKQNRSLILFTDEAFKIIMDRSDSILSNMDQRVKALENCLTKLVEPDRELIKMRYEEGLAIKDIAIEIGRPVQGMYKVFTRLHNALRLCIRKTMSMWGAA